MTYTGKVQDGVVVFDGDKPADGTEVTIESPVLSESTGTSADPPGSTLGERLMKYVGTVTGDYPADSSVNIDHYLYGLPKR